MVKFPKREPITALYIQQMQLTFLKIISYFWQLIIIGDLFSTYPSRIPRVHCDVPPGFPLFLCHYPGDANIPGYRNLKGKEYFVEGSFCVNKITYKRQKGINSLSNWDENIL